MINLSKRPFYQFANGSNQFVTSFVTIENNLFFVREIKSLVQGDTFEKSQKEIAVALKQCILDPMCLRSCGFL